MGLIAFVLISVIALGAYAIRPDVGEVMIQKPDNVQKHKKPFTSPKGIFIQVRRVSEIADNVRRLDNPLKIAGASIQAAARTRAALLFWRFEELGRDPSDSQ